MNRLFLLALGAALAASPAAAQMTGATLDFGHSFFTEDGDVAKTSLGGSAEYALGPSFGLQGDLGYAKLHGIEDDATSVALHGMVYVNPETAIGAFYGIEELAGDSVDFYGFEVGQKSDLFDVEAYVGRADNSGLTGSMMGLEGRVALSSGFGVGGKLDHLDIEGLDTTRVGLTGDYTLPNGLALTAEVGTVNADDLGLDGSEPYVGVGARFDFGRGSMFSRRNLTAVAPGL
ncbi:outer membrane beta-barrel protein [Rhodobacter sp. NSM]|uniref:outer membrane beta-barrel protein n=1 Tax=Rhodobacter sp. NSM TaxID=3457501 RepID=UPI003FD5A1D9